MKFTKYSEAPVFAKKSAGAGVSYSRKLSNIPPAWAARHSCRAAPFCPETAGARPMGRAPWKIICGAVRPAGRPGCGSDRPSSPRRRRGTASACPQRPGRRRGAAAAAPGGRAGPGRRRGELPADGRRDGALWTGRSGLGSVRLMERLTFPFSVERTRTFTACPSCRKSWTSLTKRVGDFRDVDQAGLPIVQGHESAEFGDGGHLSFQNAPYLKLHIVYCFSFRIVFPLPGGGGFASEKTGFRTSGGGGCLPRRQAPVSC